MSRPNVLYIVTHDTGRHIGGYGLGAVTPNLDRLAAGGVRFQQCYCTAPQCSPSRASATTGLMPHSNGLIGLTHRGYRLKPEVKTLAMLLGEAGYATALAGIQHEAKDPTTLGYREILAPSGRVAKVNPAALDYLARPPAQPFFLMVGYTETHRQFTSSGDAPLDDVVVPPYLPDNETTRRDFADFAVDLQRVDNGVGELLDALERNGLVENTLVIFTTDHGVAFPGAKGTLFDPGLGIATIFRGPGLPAGRDESALVQNIDFLPTIAEVCGVATPPAVQGVSLLPLLSGQVDRVHEEIFLELTTHAAYDPMRGVRTLTHKYIRSYEYRPYWFPPNVDDGLSKQLLKDDWRFHTPRPRELLFDLVADPLETTNLAREPEAAAVLEDLRERVDRFMIESADPMISGVYPQPETAIITPPTNWNPGERPE